MPIELQTNLALIPEPVAPSHVVNIAWVTRFFTGLQKAPARLVATTNQNGTYSDAAHTFSYAAAGPTTLDGEVIAIGDRILFTDQTDARHNLIYECTAVIPGTVLTVASDFNADHLINPGVMIGVTAGTQHADTTWRLTTQGTIIFQSTALDWELYEVPRTTQVFAEDFDGNGALTSWTIDHSLGSEDVSVTIYNRATSSLVMADVEVTDNNTVTISFALAPPAGAGYRAIVIG